MSCVGPAAEGGGEAAGDEDEADCGFGLEGVDHDAGFYTVS